MRGLLLLCLLAAGCAFTKAVGPYTPPVAAARNTAEAERLTREAADLIANDPAHAEALLREALTADLFHGPAHNNLGVVFLEQGELYEAAGEFEWARKLMPGHPDPRVNLALALDRAGRVDEAFESYEAALDVYPGYLPAVQGLARLVVRSRRQDSRTESWLDQVALEGETAEWRDWARGELARRYLQCIDSYPYLLHVSASLPQLGQRAVNCLSEAGLYEPFPAFNLGYATSTTAHLQHAS